MIKVDDNILSLLELVADKKLTPQELAEELDCSVPTVYRLLQKYAGSTKQKADLIKATCLEAAVNSYQEGTPIHDILANTGINVNELYTALRDQDIPLRKDGKQERDALVVQLYKNPNNTIFDIEVAIGRSTTYIYRVLHQAGVPLRRGNSDGLITIEQANFGQDKEAVNDSS